ncbi:ABC transporter permease [Luteimonas sp. RD2P54]|uniref:ABC transporter permease n=1 Tax=Luteimonas endophytica TaxID=3042023 RepID=A0ABT6JF94_9GAMM|nr:FtsX-like permease family protein [Luteimonas endophytica]MDH5824858.1 ABC transporter permease [Luteimonas endophytica]
MDIRPILSTLLRHKTAAALIVVEIALSCAIICNALFLISNRVERINLVSGVADNEIVRIQITGIGEDDNAAALTRADLALLRGLPGVEAAVATNQVPFTNSSWNTSVGLVPDQQRPTANLTQYFGDEHFLPTFGLRLLEGRNFNADEIQEWEVVDAPGADIPPTALIITRKAAERLFPGESAVGKRVYLSRNQATPVVGVVEHLIRPSDQGGPAEKEFSMILPLRLPYTVGSNIMLRTDPERRQEVLEAAKEALLSNGPNRIILEENTKTLEELRREYYQEDRAMVWLLVAVCIALLVVTALGIVGLASFWVQQRTKQIGVRRALGATRGQILRYFQVENFLLATLGIVVGMLMAYAINQLLMGRYELPRLPLVYLPVGAVALWLLGQFAVFWPARRAASVPPAVATRSV